MWRCTWWSACARRLLEGLNRGELDAAVVEGYFAQAGSMMRSGGVWSLMYVYARREARWKGRWSWKIFSRRRCILRDPESGTREILERALLERNFQLSDFRRVVEINDLTVIKQLVEQNCGITFLYRRAVERELEEGQLRQVFLRGWEVQHEFTFLWRKGSVFEQNYRRLYAKLCQNQEE